MSLFSKKYLPKGLFARTFLIVVVPVLLLQLTISIVFFERHWSKMTERLASAVVGEISAVLEIIESDPENIQAINTVRILADKHLELSFDYKPDQDSLPERDGEQGILIARSLSAELNRVISYPFTVTEFRDDKRFVVDILAGDKLLSFTVPERRIYSASSYIFILWMIGLSLIFFTIALVFMRNQIRPIYRLGLIAERMGRGIPVARFKPTGAREVRQAAEAFIQMQDRITGYIQQRTTMLAGVSHDLRTPLTRMKLQLEMMGDTPDVEAMRQDIIDMEHMIEGYLAFAKGDEGEETSRVDIDDFVEKIADDARRLNLNVTVSKKNIEQRMFWIKPKALSRAFGNFLSNAAHYAQDVLIDAQISGDELAITITDNGEGISEDSLDEVLKPFFRGDKSRNQNTSGVGLGLTIANDIIHAHGGTISLSNSQTQGGLEVKVIFPL
jgi:two-component system osmolarity sensor histidine kinase EnvZ